MSRSVSGPLEGRLGSEDQPVSSTAWHEPGDGEPSYRLQLHLDLAPHEPRYRSRGEVHVGRLLDRHKIPFFYEQPTLIHDRGRYRIWHPDFTLLGLNNLIIEYAGMPDVPDYMAGIRHKQRAYRANGIPALFVYPDHLRGPNWPDKLIERVYRTGRKTTQYMRDATPGGVRSEVRVTSRQLGSGIAVQR